MLVAFSAGVYECSNFFLQFCFIFGFVCAATFISNAEKEKKPTWDQCSKITQLVNFRKAVFKSTQSVKQATKNLLHCKKTLAYHKNIS
jgi:hypothetical protein